MSGVTKPRYTYPKGYQQTGEDKLTMQELRREYVVMMMTVMS